MHEPVESRLEDCLARPDRLPADATAHLQSCEGCRNELASMQAQSRILRSLRVEGGMEPRPGFYARVLERIEKERPATFWSVFTGAFGQRLAVASAVLAVLMGVFVYSSHPPGGPAPMPIAPASITAVDLGGREDMPAPVLAGVADQDQVRNAVFVSLATYQE